MSVETVELVQISTHDLRRMVDEMVEEKLATFHMDPDEGLEITDEIQERLLRQQKEVENGKSGEPFEDVIARLGLN